MENFKSIVDMLYKLTNAELEYIENQAFELKYNRRREAQEFLKTQLENTL